MNPTRHAAASFVAGNEGRAAGRAGGGTGHGTLILKPCDSAQPKEIPLDVFFKKITSVREKLRVLEQKLNNNESLSWEEKTEFQTLITRAYGSLTTFNILFREEKDRFTGQKSDD